MSSDDHVTKGEIWVPAGRWRRHARNWKRQVDECWPDDPGWYEARPSKRRPAVTVIGLLWIVIPCLLPLGQYGDFQYDNGWRDFTSQVHIREGASVDPAGFQETAVVTLCNPAWSLIDRIQILSDSTDTASSRPDSFEEDIRRSRSEVESLLDLSHHVTVPEQHREKFQILQLSLLSAGQSLDALEVAAGSTVPREKARYYAESANKAGDARSQLWEARKYFESFSGGPQVCSPPGYSDG